MLFYFLPVINKKDINATVLLCNEENTAKMMEKKFYEWSGTAKRLEFCKIDSHIMEHGADFKDINGKDIMLEGVPYFIVFKKGAIVRTLQEADNYFKVKRLIDRFDQPEKKVRYRGSSFHF